MPGMDISSAALGLHAPLLHRATAVLGMSPVTGGSETLARAAADGQDARAGAASGDAAAAISLFLIAAKRGKTVEEILG